jgi:anaerobic selenocysteine-containing dehydrogenase
MRKVKKEGVKDVTIVSDVDAHSQCKLRVEVKEGRVIDIRGDPLDPEGRDELTLRGKHMKSVLYAPDRLQYPMKRVGEKGGGEWERISWNEALTTIADKLGEIKKE